MRSDVVIVACVRLQNLAQMHLAQDNDVVHTLAPDRSDQTFDNAILPGRGWCGRLVPDTHGAQSARDNAAIDPIPIADEVVRSLVPRKCLRYLTRNPFGRRICCDVGPDEVSAAEPDDDEGIEPVETDSWNNEQVVPVENQIRTYWWCSPPRIGRQRMCPARSMARETGASFSKDKCVRISLWEFIYVRTSTVSRSN